MDFLDFSVVDVIGAGRDVLIEREKRRAEEAAQRTSIEAANALSLAQDRSARRETERQIAISATTQRLLMTGLLGIGALVIVWAAARRR